MSQRLEDVGVVIIGRNEGVRLVACLESVVPQSQRVVYVDSGSTDDSREQARRRGVAVIELDLRTPFTAARARNAGWRHLLSAWPQLQYVQFLDGDCELDSGWLPVAREYLKGHPQAAVACGRRRERAPGESIYNRLCDVEWNTPVGPALACGGDALMRLRALAEVDGFLEIQIAGEEPELCFRLREKSWLIERLPAEMTRHDAAMRTFRQWWRRSQRAGYSYASVNFLRSAPPEWIYRQEVRSILAWSLLLPGLTLALSIFSPYAWLLLLAYPLQVARLWRRYQSEGSISQEDRLPYAVNCVAGKFPGLLGLGGFHRDRLLARRGRLIEYK